MLETRKIVVIFSVALIALTAVIIVLSVLLAVRSSDDKSDNKIEPKICMTKSCISAANLILTNIDKTQDPCENFNKFSCGNFFKTAIIPDDSTSVDSFTNLRNRLAYSLSEALSEPIQTNDITAIQNAKRYYTSCMNETNVELNGVSQLLDFVNTQLGGWPIIDPTLDISTDDVVQKMLKFHKYGLRPFVDVYVSANPKNSDAYILRMQQSNWYLTKTAYDDEKIQAAYKTLITQMVQEFHPQASVADVDSMLSLEKELAMATLDAAQRRNQTYQNWTIAKLNEQLPGINWISLIVDGIFADHKDLNVGENEVILVLDIPYFQKFISIFNDAVANRKKDLYNLMTWYFVRGRVNSLPKSFRNIQLEFDRVYSGTSSIPPRTRTCANDINDRMPYAVGRMYVSRNFAESSKVALANMIENIRKEFKVMLGENSWMDQTSKNAANEKADYIDPKVAYPDYTYNDTYLNNLYQKYIFQPNTYVMNTLTVFQSDYQKMLTNLRQKRDRKDWISGPAVVNAFYSSSNNQICMPAGILQPPFFDSDAPNYLNYGGIGMVVGHEITHGFDDQGRRYDKDGIFFSDDEIGLWTNSTIESYKKNAQCIVDQYSNYKAEQVDMNIKGFQTQGENIADNGGIKESYRAYKKWEKENGQEDLLPGLTEYTPDQLFFINYAQIWCLKITDAALRQRIETGVHSPGEFRIRGPTSNTQDFARAFNCKPNQNNNPTSKCSVW